MSNPYVTVRQCVSFCVVALLVGCITPSAWAVTVDVSGGESVNPGLRGQNVYRTLTQSSLDSLSALSEGSSARGVAGGLDADTYDWRDYDSGCGWGTRGLMMTTLEFLRAARDVNAWPMITANVWGGGYLQGDGTWYCQYNNPAQLAADWVRYCNIIVQNYDSDNPPTTGEDLRVYNSISDWAGRDLLPDPDEAKPPKVEYWEIGNEPELNYILGLVNAHYVSSSTFASRYKTIANAMLAVDPTIKVGPCIIWPSGSGGYYITAIKNAGAPLDFVGYHPYHHIQSSWGSESSLQQAIRQYKNRMKAESDAAKSRAGSGVELMATEFNPVYWDATATHYASAANALALSEAIFTFTEEGLIASHFWEQAQGKPTVKKIYEGLIQWMGDTLVSSSVKNWGYSADSTNWRVYITKDSTTEVLYIWGLNFDYQNHQTVSLNLQNWTSQSVKQATMHRFHNLSGDTQLMTTSGLDWENQQVTIADITNISLDIEDATICVLELVPAECGDWGYFAGDINKDCFVDWTDFGVFASQWMTCNDPRDSNCNFTW